MTGAHDRLLDCDWCRELIVGEAWRTPDRGRPVHPGDCWTHAAEHEAVYARAAEQLAAALHRDEEETARDLTAVVNAYRCTCDAPPARIAADCPVHGLPALHAAGRSTHGRPVDLVIVDDPLPGQAEIDEMLAPYRRGGIVDRAALPRLEHPTGYVIPGPWLRPPVVAIDPARQAELKPALATVHAGEWRITRDDAAATLDLDQLNDTLRRVYADRGRGYQPDPIERQLTDRLPAGLEARWSTTPLEQLAAIRPAPMPAAARARLVQQLACAFGVPLADVDPARLRAELELRGRELDRWADDGGSFDDPLDLPPIVVTPTPDLAAFGKAMREAGQRMLDVFRQLAAAFVAAGRQLARAFGTRPLAGTRARRWPHDMPPRRWRDWLPATERKVDRARREHVDRQLRTLARRAARRERIRARKAAPFYAIARAGRHGAAALDVLRTAAAGAA